MYKVLTFNKHNDLKQTIIEKFELGDWDQGLSVSENRINRTDQFVAATFPRRYIKVINNDIRECLYDSLEDLEFSEYHINHFIFTEFIKGDYQKWGSLRESFYTAIYFLDLPEGSETVDLFDVFTGEHIKPKVKEGDILLFNSQTKYCIQEEKQDVVKKLIQMKII